MKLQNLSRSCSRRPGSDVTSASIRSIRMDPIARKSPTLLAAAAARTLIHFVDPARAPLVSLLNRALLLSSLFCHLLHAQTSAYLSGPGNPLPAIVSGASNTTPIVLTIGSTAGYAPNDVVSVSGLA